MKTLAKNAILAAVVAASSVGFISSKVYAVTPDPYVPINSYWSMGATFHEWFDWRSYAGWGSVNSVNTAAVALSGASYGDISAAAFSTLCGSVASGLLAQWKPASDPTAASHIKAIVKAGGVTAVSLGCGWISKTTFGKMDTEIVKAQNYINNSLTSQQKIGLNSVVNIVNTTGASADNAFTTIAYLKSQQATGQAQYDSWGCKYNPQGLIGAKCQQIMVELVSNAQKISEELIQIMEYASVVKQAMQQIDSIIKT